MSFKAAAWAISEEVTETTAEKLVLVVLADCHNAETGRCDPSHDFIAKRARMSRRTVIRVIERLEKLGLLSVTQRSKAGLKTTSFYSLACDVTKPSLNTPHDVTWCHNRCDIDDTPDVTSATNPDVTQCHINQESLRNQEIEPSARARAREGYVSHSRTCPDGWEPNSDLLRFARIPEGVDIEMELYRFRLHEFRSPVRDWDRKFLGWLSRATPSSNNNGGNKLQRTTDSLIGPGVADL